MDLGTTTVVIRLLNLETGELVADASFENPQRFGGSDVMSRIHYDTEHRGKLLRRTLAGYLTHAIEEFPVDPKTIYEVVVVGNSTMRDIFFRQNVYSIGQNPVPIDHRDRDGGGNAHDDEPDGNRTPLPAADSSPRRASTACRSSAATSAPTPRRACSRSASPTKSGSSRIMDIGTNTELILGNKHRILAASCPAGPAFEGGAIACGMPGLDGAIEDVTLERRGAFRLRRHRRRRAGGHLRLRASSI